MPFLDIVKKQFVNAITRSCEEKGCKLGLENLNEDYIVVKGEKVTKSEKICDCIIFINDKILSVVELKSKRVHARDIIDKLTSSLSISLKILKDASNKTKRQVEFDVYLLVLSKHWSTSEYRILSKSRVVVEGKKYYLILKRCGIDLSQILVTF